jgi:hypothetical protein
VTPTGYGKSPIFEILPFVDLPLYDRHCLVVLICPLNVNVEQEMTKLGSKAIRASDLVNNTSDEVKLDSIIMLWGILRTLSSQAFYKSCQPFTEEHISW